MPKWKLEAHTFTMRILQCHAFVSRLVICADRRLTASHLAILQQDADSTLCWQHSHKGDEHRARSFWHVRNFSEILGQYLSIFVCCCWP